MPESAVPHSIDPAGLCRAHGIDAEAACGCADLDALLDQLTGDDEDRRRLVRLTRDAGRQEGQVGAMRELERLEAELARLEALLDAADAPTFDIDGHFAELARLAHKINNPLTALLGRAQLLKQKRGSDPEIGKSINVIDDCAQRIASFVKELSNTVRAGRGAGPPRLRCED